MNANLQHALLHVEGLTVDFDAGKPFAHRAVNGVSLTIESGEVLGLVGESGSGKTVLAHSILGLLPSNGKVISGHVEWQGRDLVRFSEGELRQIRGKEVAMIFQDPQASLNPVYPVGQQVEWVLNLHRGITGAGAKAEVLRLFESVKLRDPSRCADSYAHELSGGMCQRVMIAMALAGRPKLLIADEPTSALDVSVAAEIVSLLASLRTTFGLSSFSSRTISAWLLALQIVSRSWIKAGSSSRWLLRGSCPMPATPHRANCSTQAAFWARHCIRRWRPPIAVWWNAGCLNRSLNNSKPKKYEHEWCYKHMGATRFDR